MAYVDIPIPETCDQCHAMDDNSDYPYCMILHESRGYDFNIREKRFPNCPMKPDSELLHYKEMCRVLFNRCYATIASGGAMCVFCTMREDCSKLRSVNSDGSHKHERKEEKSDED